MALNAEAITIVALVFGSIWLVVNLYTYSPVYQRTLFRLLGRTNAPRVYDEGTDAPDAELPTIDVLIAAYNEQETIGHTIRALRDVAYPVDKLAIYVLIEPSDRSTHTELRQLHDQYEFNEVVIPATYPGRRNKPRALNYGFEQTDGDIVGVIDAEDIVDPELFRQVAKAITEDNHDYVQGQLDMQNEGDGLLNTLFRGEYGFWYRTVIPSYFRVRYPVPLGGTTNFVQRSVLQALAAERVDRFGSPWTTDEQQSFVDAEWSGIAPWDPRNVTEDFELGLLLWETKRSMAMVTAVTRGESPVGLNAWIRQRTRWQKGKLYTFYQRLRYPPAGLRAKLHIYLQSSMPHLGAINIMGVVILAMYAISVGIRAAPTVGIILAVGLALALQQMVIQAIGYWTVTDRRGVRRIFGTVVNFSTVPLYWTLQWGADIRAFVQLAFGHLNWEKTVHTGQHIETDQPVVSEQPVSGLQAIVSRTTDGWLWRLTNDGLTLASSSQAYQSEAEARQAIEAFSDSLSAAIGTTAVFVIDSRDTDWSWVLVVAAQPTAIGLTPTETLSESLIETDRVRSAAGSASVASTSDDKATSILTDVEAGRLTG